MADWKKLRALRPRRFLDVLPEEIYDKSDNAHIVRLMAALCGDSGVGGLRKRLALKRMQTALAETHYMDLDGLYSRMFGLPRLPEEQYAYIPDELLTWAQLREMDVKDARYRRRILTYMTSFMYGSTAKGLELCAEGGCGVPCQVIDLTKYYRSIGIGEIEKDWDPIGGQGENTGHQWLVVPMQDGEPTPQQTYGMANALYSLQPADAVFYVATRAEAADVLGADVLDDVSYEPANVSASSSWWRVKRYVTGRPDWDYERYPSEWIEPNVRKEAPRQALVNCQEEFDDYSYTAKSVTASSEHSGRYGYEHGRAFPTLGEVDGDGTSSASAILGRAYGKWYTGSYYGGSAVAAWSYPVDMANLLTDEAAEVGRAPRYWSSEERTGDEWVDVELRRTVPLNRLSVDVCRKPLRVKVFFSSSTGDGERVWVPAVDAYGRQLTYTNRAFGGSSVAGDFLRAEFSFPPVYADGVRLEFERLDQPYLKTIGVQTYEEQRFEWSVEARNLEFGLDVMQKGDFMPATFPDMFGNTVETELEESSPELAFDGNDWSMWLSQPNVTQEAVEWLVVDLGEPKRFNYVDVGCVYGGVQMNVYSSDDGEYWYPYAEQFEVYGGRFRLPTRVARYVKLEFTKLCAIPYEIIREGVEVETRRFPWAVRKHVDEVNRYTRQTTYAQKLLTTPQESGAPYLRDATDTTADLTGQVNTSYLMSGAAYRTSQQSAVASAYGTDMAVERPVSSSTPQNVHTPSSKRSRYVFYEEGKHEYDVRRYYRKLGVAYVVGVGSVEVGLEASRLLLDNLEPADLDLMDGRCVGRNDGWEQVGGNRLRPSTDKAVCSLWTGDVTSACNFRSFDLTIDQSQPTEVMAHPSHMSLEWRGVGAGAESSEFGTNGTVLKVVPREGRGYGIESGPHLVHSVALAFAQVDMFAAEPGTWRLEAVDAYGEQMFSMRYNVAGRKWTTVGCTFNPQPGGGWWNRDYSYRVRLPLTGPIAEGQGAFVQCVDFEAMVGAGVLQGPDADETYMRDRWQRCPDMRLVFFDGVSCEEVPYQVTGNRELWFRACQDVPAGVDAVGSYDSGAGAYVGGYYLYFANARETGSPVGGFTRMWDSAEMNAIAYNGGRDDVCMDMDYGAWDTSGYRLSRGAGSARFVLGGMRSPVPLKRVPDGSDGLPQVRYIFDYVEEDSNGDRTGYRVSAYFFETQLVFAVRDPDGYVSSFVSRDGVCDHVLDSPDERHLFFARWGARGSDPAAPNGSARRRIDVYMDTSAQPLECIANVYDETRYFEGVY